MLCYEFARAGAFTLEDFVSLTYTTQHNATTTQQEDDHTVLNTPFSVLSKMYGPCKCPQSEYTERPIASPVPY